MRNVKKRAIGTVPVALLAVFAVAAGCANIAQKAVEKKTGVKVETEKDAPLKKVDISEIPKELVYSGAKAKEKVKVNNPQGAGEGVQVVLISSDQPEQVEAHYDTKPAAAGWNQQMKVEQEIVSYTFTKDKSWVTVSIAKEKGDTQITVFYIEQMQQ